MIHSITRPRVTQLYQLSLKGIRFTSSAVRYEHQKQLFIIPEGEQALVSFFDKKSAPSVGILKNIPKDNSLQSIEYSNKNFEENKDFLKELHALIYDKVHEDVAYQTEASPAPSSHLSIFDLRCVPAFGRTPDVDNVIGYVRVDGHGEIIPHSFEENPMYRLLDDVNGFVKLSDFLHEELLKKFS